MPTNLPTFPGRPLKLVNRSGHDTRFLDPAIDAAVRNGGVLPPELVDIFTLTKIGINSDGSLRWALDFA